MAGAGFKTFNTGDVLTSSDVNTYLMQQTVMVFDDASARSTALPTPSEGMFSYLKDTNLTYRYDGSAWLSDAGATSPLTTKGDVWGYSTTDARIPVGANGTVLTADSSETLGVKWAATAGGANWSLVNSGGTSLTGATTITVSGITGADKLLIQVRGASADANSRIQLRFNSDTGNTMHPAGLRVVASSTYSVGSYSGYYEGAVNYVELAALSGNAASTAGGSCLVSGGNSSGVKVFNTVGGATASGGNGQELLSFGGFWDNSATISSVSVISTSGNFDAGSVWVYKSA